MTADERYDTNVWTTNIIGMIAKSAIFPADSCEASFVKTKIRQFPLSSVTFRNNTYLNKA